jgi:hypothetical protein
MVVRDKSTGCVYEVTGPIHGALILIPRDGGERIVISQKSLECKYEPVENEGKMENSTVKGLRSIAEWIEQHPDLDQPSCILMRKHENKPTAHWYGIYGHDDAKQWFITMKDALVAPRYEKESDECNFMLVGDAGDFIAELAVSHYSICQRVVVGEKDVPASEAIPAMPARVEPIYAWECPSILKGEK